LFVNLAAGLLDYLLNTSLYNKPDHNTEHMSKLFQIKVKTATKPMDGQPCGYKRIYPATPPSASTFYRSDRPQKTVNANASLFGVNT
jgi:hypothetical protein